MRLSLYMASIILFYLVVQISDTSTSAAQTGGSFHLTSWTIDGGGGQQQGGAYGVRSTIGQLDAGTISGGTYQIAGGFGISNVSIPPAEYRVFLPYISY